jgi:5-methylcytosine-specific restriction endonuclease McrA
MATEEIPHSRPLVTRAQAKAAGLKRYFTGEPCKRGHLAERKVSDRKCCECGLAAGRQLRSRNPEKARENYRRWASRNPEKVKRAYEAWRHRNPEKAKASHKNWLSRNPDKVRSYAKKSYHRDVKASRRKLRERRIADPQKFKDYKTADYKKHGTKRRAAVLKRYYEKQSELDAINTLWRKNNPERARAIARNWARKNAQKLKEWRDANPDKLRVYRTLTKARRRLRVAAGGRFTTPDINRIFDQQKGKCAYCRVSLQSGFHIDHIKPLAKGGSNRPSNLQLCCADCNHSKQARDPLEFARSLEMLL